MQRRHPHVFDKNGPQLDTPSEVVEHWQLLKQKEKSNKKKIKSAITKETKKRHLPTLIYTSMLSKKMQKLGFTWPNVESLFEQVQSEIDELKAEITNPKKNYKSISEETGDVIFTLCSLLVYFDINQEKSSFLDADQAVRGATRKVCDRFSKMEELIRKEKKNAGEIPYNSITLDDWDRFWRQAKILTHDKNIK